MKIIQLNDDAYWAERRIAMAEEFPGSRIGLRMDLTPEAVDDFEDALLAGSEEAIHQVLAEHPYLLQYATPRSGHHGLWAYSKQVIRTRSVDGAPGLIPDFLIVTRSSLGDFWHVVELKRFDEQFSDARGTGYSSAGHKALAQCAGYLAHFREYIEAIRVNAGVSKLTQPTGAIILMGDSETETDQQTRNRSNFVRASSTIDVVTYRRLLWGARSEVGFTERGPGLMAMTFQSVAAQD
nr:hypothetical protein [uncultured Brevundimonas sp.]